MVTTYFSDFAGLGFASKVQVLFKNGEAHKSSLLDFNNSNLTDFALDYYKMNQDDLFSYIYGLLHSETFVKKYDADLKKATPRIPLVIEREKYIEIGKKLINLHLNYEYQPVWNDVEVVYNNPNPSYKVTKMKHPKKGVIDTIIYNNHIQIKNIPEKAYEYVINGRPAIEWIIDQYRIKPDTKSGIIDDPNEFSDDPKYILNLLLSVITVSMKTLELIEELPEFEILDS